MAREQVLRTRFLILRTVRRSTAALIKSLPGRPFMWVRQCDLDAQADATFPIPSKIASNEEFIPPAQSPQQREYETRLDDLSDHAARRQGMNRRAFLRTGSGTAAALLELNQA